MNQQPNQEPNNDASSLSDTPTQSHCPENGSPDTSTLTPDSPTSPSTTTEPSPSDPPDAPPIQHQVRQTPLYLIQTPDPKNARLQTDPEHIRQLASDFQQHGQLHPITLAPNDDGYTLVAGNNRLLAAKLLGWETIASIVISQNRMTVASVRLAENLTRANLSPIEEAVQLNELIQLHPFGLQGIAQVVDRRPEWILGRLDLLDWPPNLQEQIHAGRISMTAGAHLAKIHDHEKRDRYIRHAANHGISAATASLWRREADTDFLRESKTSEFCAFSPERELPGKRQALCRICGQLIQIHDITVLHCCTSCRSAIESSLQPQHHAPQQQPPQPHQPNPDDPDPRSIAQQYPMQHNPTPDNPTHPEIPTT